LQHKIITDYSNQLHQLLVSVSRHLYVTGDGFIKYQEKLSHRGEGLNLARYIDKKGYRSLSWKELMMKDYAWPFKG
jgi:hypothetical protein